MQSALSLGQGDCPGWSSSRYSLYPTSRNPQDDGRNRTSISSSAWRWCATPCQTGGIVSRRLRNDDKRKRLHGGSTTLHISRFRSSSRIYRNPLVESGILYHWITWIVRCCR